MRAARPGIAIIGAGLMGQWHAAAAARAGADVLSVCDRESSRRGRLAARFGARAFETLEELLAWKRPAVAHLCTPAGSHVPIARCLIDAGLHVVCEKPLAADAADVAALYEHALHAGRRLCPVHQFTTQRGVADAMAWLPRIGPLKRLAFIFSSAGGARLAASELDQLLLDILPHPLSVLAKLQPQHRLQSVEWDLRSPTAGELIAVGAQGEATVSISISLAARPTEASATAAGEHGTIRLDFFHGYAFTSRGRPSRADKALRPFATSLAILGAASASACRRLLAWEPAYPGLRELLARFYASLDGPGEAPFSDAEVIDIYRARDAIRERMPRVVGA